jgi:hypothetical protein
MRRLIEVQRVEACASPMAVTVGDVLVIGASGGRVVEGGPVVELWGPLHSAVVGTDGAVVAPMGPPNTVLIRACRPGSATIELFTGDPFGARRAATLRLTVGS